MIIALFFAIAMSSCATVYSAVDGQQPTAYQTTKPLPGQPGRQIRTLAFVLDFIFLPGMAVDFATRAIYRPAPLEGGYLE